MKGGTNEVETEFTDYDKITFSVTGTLANGKEYTTSNKLPTEVGRYTLHIVVGEGSAFFKCETSNLPVTVNEDGTISFSADKFSSYALAMRDIEKSSTPLVVTIVAIAVLLVIFGGYMVLRKKKSAVE